MSNVLKNRRENLHWVIKVLGSQTEVASKLNHEVLTQQILSSIVRGKRPMHEGEARTFEKKIGIPAGWMDKPDWVKDGWNLIKAYRSLDNDNRQFISKISTFIIGKCT